MNNEQIVEQIQNGYSVTDNMQLLYENNLPLIKQFIKPYAAYESTEDLLQENRWEIITRIQTDTNNTRNIWQYEYKCVRDTGN